MEPNIFWQINFWGLVGTISGIAGFLVALFSYIYNIPKIKITHMVLITPDSRWINAQLFGKKPEDLKDRFLDYKLEINVRNSRGGAGSIDKPTLLVKIPYGKNLFLFQKFKEIKIFPNTEETKYKRIDSVTSEIYTVRHGRAFNLSGGQSIDDLLEYSLDKATELYEVIQKFNNLKYFVEYYDNNGIKCRKKIIRVIPESELE